MNESDASSALEKMSMAELRALQTAVHERILVVQREGRAAALAAARAAAAEHGFELEMLIPLQLTDKVPGTGRDVAEGKTAKTGPVNPPRYAKPGEPGVTWTGRGRRPTWIIDHLVGGGDLKALEIR
jgi:DNA-binding protein H-NS